MSLSNYERELLTLARTIVASEIETIGTRFICCAIQEANQHLLRKGSANVIHEDAAEKLRDRIQDTLDGNYTFEAYFYTNYGYRPERYLPDCEEDVWDDMINTSGQTVYLSWEDFKNLVKMARLAWIDRMLDNNEVS